LTFAASLETIGCVAARGKIPGSSDAVQTINIIFRRKLIASPNPMYGDVKNGRTKREKVRIVNVIMKQLIANWAL
jgi:hypothetical protein